MSHKMWERDVSTAKAEMMTGLRVIAASDFGGEGVKAALRRITSLTRFKPSRARELYYGRAKPEVEEMDRVRALVASRKRASEEAKQDEELHREIAALRSRVAAVEALLVQQEHEEHRLGA